MATTSSNLTSYDSGYSAYSVSELNNALAGPENTSYAQINLTRGSGGVTQIYYNFGLNIPSGATIDSVTCSCKCYISTTTSTRIATRQAQLYSGSTAMGEAHTINGSSNIFTITAGTWTAAQLSNAKLRLYVVRGSSSVNNAYYLRLHGATINVTYTEATGNKIYIKVSGGWVQAQKVYVKVNGSWNEVNKVSKKENGSWVEQQDKSAMFENDSIMIKG